MPKAIDRLKESEKKKVHFIYHGELHYPVKNGHNEGVYYYTNGSIVPEKRKLIEFCSMCGKKLKKGITKTLNQYTHIIE